VQLTRKFFRRRGFWNLLSLYVSLGSNAIVSLLLIAYLARALGPGTWGIVLMAHVLGFWLALVPEYGFTLSATRSLAQAATDRDAGEVAHSVLAAKLLLCAAILPVAGLAWLVVPAFQNEPMFLVGAITFAVAQGFDSAWLFQGVERQYIYAICSTLARLLVFALAAVLVNGPGDASIVMFLHTLGSLFPALAGFWYIRKKLPRSPIRKSGIRTAMVRGWKMFQFRGAQSLTAHASILIVGIVSPRGLDAFGSADRIVRNCLGLMGPLSGAGLPRIARLLHSDVSAAHAVAKLSLAVMFAFGLVASILLVAFAQPVVTVLLGPDYNFVVPTLRVVALMLPFAAVSTMIGIQWMVPHGLDSLLVKITFAGGVVAVIGCVVLGHLYSATGAAVAMVVGEALIAVGLVVGVQRQGQSRLFGQRESIEPRAAGQNQL
jgi:polysaccharide transporter, PST family